MLRLSIIVTTECETKEEVEQKLANIKNRLQGAGVKMSASAGEMLQKPENV